METESEISQTNKRNTNAIEPNLVIFLQVRAVRDRDERRVEVAHAGTNQLLLHVLADGAGAFVQQREQRPVVEQSVLEK